MSKLYRVKGWDEHFEGSKSKTFNNKSQCMMPCKHGLGFRRLIREDDGAALFGAWCAMVQILSGHRKPRSGWITTDGTQSGTPYSPEDFDCLTGIDAKYFSRMLEIVSSDGVDWIEEASRAGGGNRKQVAPQPPEPPPEPQQAPKQDEDPFGRAMALTVTSSMEEMIATIHGCHPDAARISNMQIENLITTNVPEDCVTAIRYFVETWHATTKIGSPGRALVKAFEMASKPEASSTFGDDFQSTLD